MLPFSLCFKVPVRWDNKAPGEEVGDSLAHGGGPAEVAGSSALTLDSGPHLEAVYCSHWMLLARRSPGKDAVFLTLMMASYLGDSMLIN